MTTETATGQLESLVQAVRESKEPAAELMILLDYLEEHGLLGEGDREYVARNVATGKLLPTGCYVRRGAVCYTEGSTDGRWVLLSASNCSYEGWHVGQPPEGGLCEAVRSGPDQEFYGLVGPGVLVWRVPESGLDRVFARVMREVGGR